LAYSEFALEKLRRTYGPGWERIDFFRKPFPLKELPFLLGAMEMGLGE